MRKLVLLFVAAALPGAAVAQDTHYWNLHYGAKTTLLGGAVIGSVDDLGATFYNPGMIALIDDPEFVISAKVYEYSDIKLENGAGEGFDLTSSNFTPAPSLVAGSFRQSWMGNNRFSYSVLTRQRMNFNVESGSTARVDVIGSAPGDEFFAAGVRSDQRMNDIWAGLTWSRGITDITNIGVTQYLAIRSQDRRTQALAAALSDSGDVAEAIMINDYRYRDWRALWKIGLAFDLESVTLGLTVTTPSVHLFGSGDASTASVLTGVDTDNDGVEDPFFLLDDQNGVDSEYRSPWAVGLGAGYRKGQWRLHASAEWYDEVPAYDVLNTEPFTVQSTGETEHNRFIESLESVFNWGLGAEYDVSERHSVYGSFTTDFSAGRDAPEVNHSVSIWDIYHVAGGVVLEYEKLDLTLGATWVFGNQTVERNFDLSNPGEESDLVGEGGETRVKTNNINAILGFRFRL